MSKIDGLPDDLTLSDEYPKIADIVEIALFWALARNPNLEQFPRDDLRGHVQRILDTISTFHEVSKQERPISVDTDVVFVLSGSGNYNEPLVEDVYKPYPWALATDFLRLQQAAKVIKSITAARMGIPIEEVGSDNIKKSGPILVYNGRPHHNQALREAMAEGRFELPSSNIKIIDTFKDEDGDEQPYANTINQMIGFRQSEFYKSNLRRIIVLSHDAHLTRALHIMGKHCVLPKDTILQAYPLTTASWGIIEHAILEVSGILYYSLVTTDATIQPHPYELDLPSKLI